MAHLAYIIGIPGAGKSTLTAATLQHLTPATRTTPFAHTVYRDTTGNIIAAQPGAPHHTFPGTDRLSMGIQPHALNWLNTQPAPVILAEGDRLGNLKFLTAAHTAGHTVTVIHLITPPDTATARRATRTTQPHETWVTGRHTKIRNIVTRWAHDLITLDGTAPPDHNAATLRAYLRIG